MYEDCGEDDKAKSLFAEAEKAGARREKIAAMRAKLGMRLLQQGRRQEGIALLEEALAKARNWPKFDPQKLFWLHVAVFTALDGAGDHARAAALYREVLQQAERVNIVRRPMFAQVQAMYGLKLLQRGKFVEAEPVLRQCLQTREQTQPQAWNTFCAQSMLGCSLLGQKKYQDAEPLLLAGYQGMKQREHQIPPEGRPRLVEAAKWLVELYEALSNEQEAKGWRQRLAALSLGSSAVK
jgi:tetratricopeptide (TPR) repeat protein